MKVIKYVGKSLPPPSKIETATKTIELPDEKTQLKGWSGDDANFAFRHFPNLYKELIKKGK